MLFAFLNSPGITRTIMHVYEETSFSYYFNAVSEFQVNVVALARRKQSRENDEQIHRNVNALSQWAFVD